MPHKAHPSLTLVIDTVLADNVFLPSSLADVSLPVANITATGFMQADAYTIKVRSSPTSAVMLHVIFLHGSSPCLQMQLLRLCFWTLEQYLGTSSKMCRGVMCVDK